MAWVISISLLVIVCSLVWLFSKQINKFILKIRRKQIAPTTVYLGHETTYSDLLGWMESLVEEFLQELKKGYFPSVQAFVDRATESRNDLQQELKGALLTYLGDQNIESQRVGVPFDVSEYVRHYPEYADDIHKHLKLFAVAPPATTSPLAAFLGPYGVPRHGALFLLGDFLVSEIIGRGGMGIVCLAKQISIDRYVALKIRTPQPIPAQDDYSKSLFAKEANHSGKLLHAHIVSTYSVHHDYGLDYFAMPLVQCLKDHNGPGLDEHLKLIEQDSKTWKKADWERHYHHMARIGSEISDAFVTVHDAQFVHKDCTPKNILLDRYDRAWLADFGLSHTFDSPVNQSGTPGYVPPEHWIHNSTATHHPTGDIFTLGVTLCQALTFQGPYVPKGPLSVSDNTRAVKSYIDQLLKSTSRKGKAIPRDLVKIVQNSTNVVQTQRYQKAEELTKDLHHFLKDEPLERASFRSLRVAWRWSRKNRGFAAILIAVPFLLAGLIALLFYYQESKESSAYNDARKLLLQADKAWRQPYVGRQDATDVILKQIMEKRGLIRPGKDRDYIDLELRSIYLASHCALDFKTEAHVFNPNPDSTNAPWPVVMPESGSYIILGTPDGPRKWIVGEKELQQKAPFDTSGYRKRPRLSLSQDDRVLAVLYQEKGVLELWDPVAMQLLGTFHQAHPIKAVHMARLVPTDHIAINVCDQIGRLLSFKWDGSQFSEPASVALEVDASEVTSATWSDDGTLLTVATISGSVRVFNHLGKLLARHKEDDTYITSCSWSPDRKLLAIGSRNGRVKLLEFDGGLLKVSYERTFSQSDIDTVLFTQEGRWLVVGGRAASSSIIELRSKQLLLNENGKIIPWAFSIDGKRWAFSNAKSLGLATLKQEQAVRKYYVETLQDQAVLSRNNDYIATLDAHFLLKVIRVHDNALVYRANVPYGDNYVSNSAVAIDSGMENGKHYCYVVTISSDNKQSMLCVYDAIANVRMDKIPLPASFASLACKGARQFIAVTDEFEVEAEERDKDSAKRQATNSYKRLISLDNQVLTVSPSTLFRPKEPGDFRRSLSFELSVNGKYFLWYGPRKPDANRRYEIWETVSNKRLMRLEQINYPFGCHSATLLNSGVVQFCDNDSKMSYYVNVHDLIDGQSISHMKAISYDDASTVRLLQKGRLVYQVHDVPDVSSFRMKTDSYNIRLSEHTGDYQKNCPVSHDNRFFMWFNSDHIMLADLPEIDGVLRRGATDGLLP